MERKEEIGRERGRERKEDRLIKRSEERVEDNGGEERAREMREGDEERRRN